MPEQWDTAPVWADARDRTREEVRSAFAPRPKTCHACGAVSETAARNCPKCGAPYVEMRPRMSRRAKRRLAGVILTLAVAGAVVAVALSPSIDRAKRATRAREAAQHAAFVRSETARLRADERLHHGRADARGAGRAGLVAELERAILGDARARVRSGTLHGPVLRANCSPVKLGPLVPNAKQGGYECLAVVADIPKEGHGATAVGGTLGYPFWAIVDYRRRSFAWCKIDPPPGEQAVQSSILAVKPPAGCDLRT